MLHSPLHHFSPHSPTPLPRRKRHCSNQSLKPHLHTQSNTRTKALSPRSPNLPLPFPPNLHLPLSFPIDKHTSISKETLKRPRRKSEPAHQHRVKRVRFDTDTDPSRVHCLMSIMEPMPTYTSPSLPAPANAMSFAPTPSGPFPISTPKHLKQDNPKRLSLALSLPLPTPLPLLPEDAQPQSVTMPTAPAGDSDDGDTTPYTAGPPKTPALAMSVGRGRGVGMGGGGANGLRRPSLLSLVTQPPTGDSSVFRESGWQVPTLPMSAPRRRSKTAGEYHDTEKAYPTNHHANGYGSLGGSGSRSAHPNLSTHNPINTPFSSSPTASTSTTSLSTSTTPFSSPPLPMPIPSEPYADGPVEIVPGVYLGGEESVYQMDLWAPRAGTSEKGKVRVLNVAQEIEDPFALPVREDPMSGTGIGSGSRKGKEKVGPVKYEVEGRDLEYCHLRWSHGEGGLAEIPSDATLDRFILPQLSSVEGGIEDEDGGRREERWGLWRACLWIEEGRRRGVPVLIHCQCGISRSATVAIAYTMCLAASGVLPSDLGHLRIMQETYDYIKGKSACIGPNVSLVFQLVEFARNLTTLLTNYPNKEKIITSWPREEEVEMSEREWARRRAAFDLDPEFEEEDGDAGMEIEMELGMDVESVRAEARMWDLAMEERRKGR